MSAVEAQLRHALVPQIKKLAADLPAKFMADMGDVFQVTDNERVLAALARIRDMKIESMTASNGRHARAYAEGVEQELGGLTSLFLSQKVIRSKAAASAVTQAFKMALDGLVEVGKAAVSVLVSGTIKGLGSALSGVDPGSVFHT